MGWRFVASLGIISSIFAAVFTAPLVGKAQCPENKWGVSQPDFLTLWNEYTIVGLIPPLMMSITAIPTVLVTYIVVS